jgi:hypothetical protein
MSTIRRCSPPSLFRAEEEPMELFSLPLLLSVERERSFMTMTYRVLTSADRINRIIIVLKIVATLKTR